MLKSRLGPPNGPCPTTAREAATAGLPLCWVGYRRVAWHLPGDGAPRWRCLRADRRCAGQCRHGADPGPCALTQAVHPCAWDALARPTGSCEPSALRNEATPAPRPRCAKRSGCPRAACRRSCHHPHHVTAAQGAAQMHRLEYEFAPIRPWNVGLIRPAQAARSVRRCMHPHAVRAGVVEEVRRHRAGQAGPVDVHGADLQPSFSLPPREVQRDARRSPIRAGRAQ
jgi:hypothetical protein